MSRDDGLPKGWAMDRLDAIAFVNPKKLVPDAQPDERFNFVPMSAVTEEFGGIDISALRPFSEVQNGYTQFQAGDVISAKITPCMENGKMAVVPELDNVCAYGSTEFHVLRPRPGISSQWIAYYLLQSRIRRDAKRNMTGSAGHNEKQPQVGRNDSASCCGDETNGGFAMTSVTLEQAQAMLPETVRQLQPGEEITITDHEQPLAQVRKAPRTSWPCKAGSAKDSILRIAPDFDAPLDEFREYME